MSRSRLPQTPGWWFDGSPPPWWARLLALPYGVLIALRRAAYRCGLRRKLHPGVPVLVVGNIVAGGSGKTPLVIAVVQHLRAAGWAPGVASRGYGREQPNVARFVDASTAVALAGDEPALIAQATGAKVRVDRNRVAAAQALVAAGCDIVVCDDGLQHYRLARDIEIEVQDVRRRYGNGRLLPAGPLREPIERAADCSLRVVNQGVVGTGSTAQSTAQSTAEDAWPMQLQIAALQPLAGGRTLALEAFAGTRVHAVAGIGEPERFFAMLRAAGLAVVPHPFPDHHQYQLADVDFGSPLPILMTAKDAVKCAGFNLPSAWVVPIEAQLSAAFWQALRARLPSPAPMPAPTPAPTQA